MREQERKERDREGQTEEEIALLRSSVVPGSDKRREGSAVYERALPEVLKAPRAPLRLLLCLQDLQVCGPKVVNKLDGSKQICQKLICRQNLCCKTGMFRNVLNRARPFHCFQGSINTPAFNLLSWQRSYLANV